MTANERRPAAPPAAQRTIGLAAGFGTWLLLSGVFFTGVGWIVVHNVLVGAAIAIVASYAAAFPAGGPLPVPTVVMPVVAAVFGLWTIASVAVFGPSGILFWNNVVIGAIVALLGIASVYTRQQTPDVSATGAD